MTEVLIAIAAFSAGAIGTWIVCNARAQAALAAIGAQFQSLQAQHAERGSELQELKLARDRTIESLRAESGTRSAAEEKAARVPELEAKLTQRDRSLADAGARHAELETRIVEERKAAAEKLAVVDQVQQEFSNAFKALSSEALKSNNQSFLELAKATLERFQEGAQSDLAARHKAVDELIKPIKDSLEKVDGKLGEIEKDRVSAYSALTEQMKGLVETHLPMLHNETANLVKALRQPNVRGRWGEIQLKRVVEMAGMLDYCDFREQENVTTEDGRLRPDLIVKLPGGKQIVVDSKAALTAYLEATETTDEALQQAHLAHHARQVRDHMVSLGRKGYQERFNPTPEFVVLFMPGEMFFSAALQQDPGLIEFGVGENVIPATPTTLISLLKAVAYGWRQESLAKNAQEIADLGKQLYERIATLGGHWMEVGNRLDRAVEAYNRSVGTLEQRVLVSARRLRDLKAAPDDADIAAIEPIERSTRALQATLFAPPSEDENDSA